MNAAKNKSALNSIYLSLGTNINPQENLVAAYDALSQELDLITISSMWSGPPYGIDGPDFFNSAALIQSPLSMHPLKQDVLRGIERKLGRKRTGDKFAPRTIDLDILIFNDMEIEIDIWRYAYLAVPLAEIHPDYRNPRTGESLSDFAKQIKGDTSMFIVQQKEEK